MAKYTTKQFIEAIQDSGGIIETIARRVGCHWATAKKYVTEYKTVQDAYESEVSRIYDIAQSNIIKSIQDGSISDSKWYLMFKQSVASQENTGPVVVKAYVGFDPDLWDAEMDSQDD